MTRVKFFLNSVGDTRRRDSFRLLEMMKNITGGGNRRCGVPASWASEATTIDRRVVVKDLVSFRILTPQAKYEPVYHDRCQPIQGATG